MDLSYLYAVGYSTCHWCHVMERESFESEEIAQILNDKFVSVKVDREERPDVDKVYMTYIQVVFNQKCKKITFRLVIVDRLLLLISSWGALVIWCFFIHFFT